jgi:hypothetical protein
MNILIENGISEVRNIALRKSLMRINLVRLLLRLLLREHSFI